jgi:hypothetical protein
MRFILKSLFLVSVLSLGLSADEKPATVYFYYEDHPPFSFEENGAVKGIFAEAAADAAKAGGLQVIWQKSTFNRIKRELEAGTRALCVPGQSKGGSPAGLQFTNSIGQFGRSGLLVHARNKAEIEAFPSIEGLFADTNYIGGFVEGAIYAVPYRDFLGADGARHLFTASSHEAIALLVAKGRVDFTFENELMVPVHKDSIAGGEQLEFVWLPGMPLGREAYIVCSAAVPEGVIKRLNSGIQATKKAAP